LCFTTSACADWPLITGKFAKDWQCLALRLIDWEMCVALESDSADGPETTVWPYGAAAAAEPLAPPEVRDFPPPGVPGSPTPHVARSDPSAGTIGWTGDQAAALLAGISEGVTQLANSSERYHARAEQREGVIDHLRSEVEKLRRGERRALLRPLLVEICRLRDDLLRQAEDLPGDFDTERARLLLRSYADSVELALENSGVVTFAPDSGDPFEPRMHRRVGGEPNSAPALSGCVARVRRSGYLDVDANSPIAPAEVVVFGAVTARPANAPATAQPTDPADADPETSAPAFSADKRNQL
jgi:hypothetical protein